MRIDDIDPPREVPGAADTILRTLEAFHLEWDGELRYQSTRFADYALCAAELVERGQAYRCGCTRREISERARSGPLGPRYPGTCRKRRNTGPSGNVRVVADGARGRFHDRLQGECSYDVPELTGDYVILRRNALPAYHLAVVLDDADQKVTHIVRGADLLETTGLHIHLQQTLGLTTPAYCHVPVIVNRAGQKLSKQTGAQPVGPADVRGRAAEILGYLGLRAPADMSGAPPRELWTWAAERWTLKPLNTKTKLPLRADMVGRVEIH